MIRTLWATFAAILLAGCGTPPIAGDTVWVSVRRVLKPADLEQSWNRELASRVHAASLTAEDIEAGRLLHVGCGIGSDHGWGSYAILPKGPKVSPDKVLEVRVDQPTTDDRLGLNPVVGFVDWFRFPGSLRKYEFIPDWREKGLRSNLRTIPLLPEQKGRYESVHSDYLIACKQRPSQQ